MSYLSESLVHAPAAMGVRPTRVKRVLARLRAFGRSLTRRREVYALSRLDDRLLSDIGVTRSDLAAASRWSLWGDPGERLTAIAEERRAARKKATVALKAREI